MSKKATGKKPAAKKAQPAKKAAAVEKKSAEAAAPAAEEAPAVEETPATEEAPAVEETPAVEEAPVEETPAAEEPPAPKEPPLRVLFAASECVPFVKTGGLADVIGALPKELRRQGVDARVIVPLYSAIGHQYREQMSRIAEFYVQLGWRSQYCGILTLEQDGVPVYFVDNEYYFGRGYIYGESTSDEGERFAFFSKAVLEAMPHIGFFPDVLHANDWQAAMSIALLRMQYGRSPDFRRVRTVYTIHNLRYQGVFSWPFMDDLLSIGPENFTGERLEYYGDINFTKGALTYADAITTVSPTYAREIQGPEYGETLDGVLRWRSRDIHGIMNGIDEVLFDPATDRSICKNYSLEDMSGKAACKEALRTEFWLDKDMSPIIGMVTRFTDQKGLDLVEYAISSLVEKGVQLAVLGSGDARYEHLFSWASWRYGGRIAARYSYDTSIANRIYAGADMFLMPSRFEPCGLAQLIALRYGTLPIVRETGGLKDSITPYNKFTGEGLGFTFGRYDHLDMLGAVDRAIEVYRRPELWQGLMKNAMSAHFTCERSAREYIDLYDGLCGRY